MQEQYIADPTDVNRTALAHAKMAVKHAVSTRQRMLGRGHWQREQLGAEGIKVTSGAAPRCVSGAWGGDGEGAGGDLHQNFQDEQVFPNPPRSLARSECP